MILTTSVVGLIETEAADASGMFRRLASGAPSNRSGRLLNVVPSRWQAELDSPDEMDDCGPACVSADFARLKADLEAEFARLVERMGNR